MKKKLLFVVSVAVMLCMTACGSSGNGNNDKPLHNETGETIEGNSSKLKAKGKENIRLVSYNVGIFNKYIKDDYQLIADMMKEAEADVVCMNELDSVTTRTNNIYQLEYAAKCLGNWYYCYGPAMDYKGGKYGEGLTSHLKPIDQYYIPLEKGDGSEPRVLVVMEFQDFVVATTHLDHKSATAQKNQASLVSASMLERYGNTKKPVFLGGDLNATPDSETIAILKENWSIISTTSDYTFSTETPKSCIDYFMLLNNGAKVKVTHTQVITELKSGDVRKASDHFPILVDVMLSE